ncbi:MAG: bidirectional hydrogenase complex protein HoxE [Cyanobacteriota bacterium]|jgi:bidirectional [NiFe] hydrogenase diaphorase subunit|nr:bidirectional hydrogenase complex protein HoxE [Cyanobacteriota bacterium]
MATTATSEAPRAKPPQSDPRHKRLDMAMKRHQYRPDALIEVLHVAQEVFGYLEEEVLTHVAHGLKLPLSKVYGVATFYHLFSLKPSGAHSCVVCMGTACYVKGSGQILDGLRTELGIEAGETTADGQVSLTVARCLGACGIAPAIVLDGAVLGKLEPAAAIAQVQALGHNPGFS